MECGQGNEMAAWGKSTGLGMLQHAGARGAQGGGASTHGWQGSSSKVAHDS